MIADATAGACLGCPQFDDARLAQTQNHACPLQEECGYEHPDRSKDQEKLGCNNEIDNEEAVGDPGKHLRSRQRHE